MSRRHIQIIVPTLTLTEAQPDWMDHNSFLGALGLPAERIEGIKIVRLIDRPEYDAYFLLAEHPSYPEVAEFAEAPVFPWNAPEVLHSASGS